ncbi:hypothetical protein L8P05_18980 [Enterobacter cloacae]|uniref:hypothetical protein n=1 Tax=Enterobacter cloacae complex TaxID=354276 RepID=UPI00200373D4|nr:MULTISPECIES: hypothetical protein [Enterobacter cloacae complex]MCK7176008.1 hypothetical protein [Enterobacter cloacae]
MQETYQAVFDAIRNENIGHHFAMAKEDIRMIFSEYATPAAIYRPTLSQDGNAWLAIYGDLPTGVVGAGSSPEEAMRAFNKEWFKSAA